MNILTRKISIHAPPRGATDGRVGNLRLRISIHAPPRGATNVYWLRPPAEQFQFTPLREGRLCVRCCVPACRIFQFTPLREGRRRRVYEYFSNEEFQFTPLREGRPGKMTIKENDLISIHAPPRGATGVSFSCLLWLSISIHAPPRGATSDLAIATGQKVFQFTPLREGRRASCPPARTRTANFNSRPSARGDHRFAEMFFKEFISIHAPPRGATSSRTATLPALADFNSRPSARGDGQRGRLSGPDEISIHAPPRGATRVG